MDRKKQIDRVLDRITDLPAMPDLVADVLRMTDDPGADLEHVGAAIERDPALAAKILKVSNSPYYGMKKYVGTLKLSLVILGMREVRNIVLGITVFDALRDSKGVASVGHAYWSHSFSTAALAKTLGALLQLDLQGEAFVAGLIHDIGKLMLLRDLGDEYGQVYRTESSGSALLEAERKAYGFTHADAAAALAEKWNFPQTLTDAIWMHHPTEEAALSTAKDPCLAAIVRLANLLARNNAAEANLASAQADAECWKALASAPQAVAPEDRGRILRELLDNAGKSPLPIL
jgi:putative nucleotidyltransferase with HDIG domain